jgi:predicted transposase YbfD/YdcC
MGFSRLALRRHFAPLQDPRVGGRTTYRLIDLIVIAVCGVICGCQDWQEIETFAHKRHAWLKRFLHLPESTPAHDTFERLFDRLDPLTFQRCLLSWIQAASRALGLHHLAIDGKTLRGSTNAASSLGPLHLVSAWATTNHLTLGQVAVDAKSNEITAIPQLLELLDLHGALVTIDAMGCQKDIAAKIIEGGGDYVLAVKDNQPHLLEDIQECFARALDTNFAGMEHSTYETKECCHGRQIKRCYTILHRPEGIRDREAWTSLRVIGMCWSERTVQGERREEVRYFIGSFRGSARRYGTALRDHWRIENSLHWHLDVTFGEDASRVQRRHEAENLAFVRKIALSLLKRHPSKRSVACKQLAAALDTDFLQEILDGASKIDNV